jgi:chemotaxis protein CheZ
MLMVQLRQRPFMAEIQRAKRNGHAEPAPPPNGVTPAAALPAPMTVALNNDEVLSAISALGHKLDRFLSTDHTQIEKIQIEISDIAGRIQATKVEMAALRHPLSNEDKFHEASEQLGAVVRATEEATNQIMAATEEIEDIVNEVRAQLPEGYQNSRLKDLNELTLRIFESCNFQDLTGQRITKVVQALSFIEQRIEGMMSVWNQKEFEALPLPPNLARKDAGLDLHGPAEGKGNVSQADIDALFD